MTPLPLEGAQTPVQATANQLALPPEGNRGGQISLSFLIDLIVQRTYHELIVLAELLPRKTDMERKIEIYNFAARTRQLFIRLLALVKWASSASKVDKSSRIMSFLDKQSMLFVDTADILARMARETLVQASLPNFQMPAAVEVLTTGTYSRLPLCIRERIVPADPITAAEKKSTLLRLNQVIQQRLVMDDLIPQMRNLKIENGRVTFYVEREFEVSLTVMGDGPSIPWRLLDVQILVDDKEIGEGKPLVHMLQINYIHQVIQSRLVDNANPLAEVFNCLHFFCQSLQLEVLYTQTLKLIVDRLKEYIHINEYTPGKCLMISYWRELTKKDPNSELGYKLAIQVDNHDPARPLSIVHTPSLGDKENEIAERAIKSDVLSMERLLVHTIYVRTKSRLNEIKGELHNAVKNIDCTLQGSPAILSVAILQPCLRAEQLLVTVDIHTGMVQCHVPQYPTSLTSELCDCLNGDYSKLPKLISDLRFWITQRRCEKTLQHLPATTYDRLPLIYPEKVNLIKSSKCKMFVKLHRHSNIILIVHLKEKPTNPCEIDYTFQLAVVKASSIDDNMTHIQHDDNIESEIPKIYLKVLTILEFDQFLITHGPFTAIVPERESHDLTFKRKLSGAIKDVILRKQKQPAYFIPELAHVVALCDERLPFIVFSQELYRRNISHQGLQVQSNAIGMMLKIVKLPSPSTQYESCAAYKDLLQRLLSITVRIHGKSNLKSWVVEFVFYSSPVSTVNPKEQGNRRPVVFYYELLTSEAIAVTVDALLNDWFQIVHLYLLVFNFNEHLKIDKNILSSICCLKSYNYNKLIIGYGADRGALALIVWKAELKKFKLVFLSVPNSLNAHSLMRHQLEYFLNENKNLSHFVKALHETYKPVLSISKLPMIPQLGVYNLKPQAPVQTFTIIPISTTLVRISYQSVYCIEVRFKGNGIVWVRDGAYSRYDRSCVVQGFTPTQGLKSFLSKYVDESAMQKIRSQNDDDNPPSPVSMDVTAASSDNSHLSTNAKFHQPLTPPSVSNPHTPASPHGPLNQQSHSAFGASPATTQFNLSSPPMSSSSNINPSPLPVMPSPSNTNFVPNSPLNAIQSPAANMVSNSPGPNAMIHSPASGNNAPGSTGGYMQSAHSENSPFPSQSILSPVSTNWPNSPGGPRSSPARSGQSPLGHPINSPQPEHKMNTSGTQMSRILPQRSWAGAVPTILTTEAFEILCCSTKHPQGIPGTEMSPLERFLGSVYMRKQLQKFIQNEQYLMALQVSEPGYVHFKIETLQCIVGLNPQHFQSLHLKVSPTPENKDLWSNEELQVVEKFFDTKVVAPPFKPNSVAGFCCMLSVPINVLKDFIRIMRLDLVPSLCQQQQFKWTVQLCLRAPPSAPIIPVGSTGVIVSRSKILFFLQITRIGLPFGNSIEPISIVLPFVYDIHSNMTQLAEKRDSGPGMLMASASHQLKRFAEFNMNSHECSLYPAIHDLLANMILPNEAPTMQNQQVLTSPIGCSTLNNNQMHGPAINSNPNINY